MSKPIDELIDRERDRCSRCRVVAMFLLFYSCLLALRSRWNCSYASQYGLFVVVAASTRFMRRARMAARHTVIMHARARAMRSAPRPRANAQMSIVREGTVYGAIVRAIHAASAKQRAMRRAASPPAPVECVE